MSFRCNQKDQPGRYIITPVSDFYFQSNALVPGHLNNAACGSHKDLIAESFS